MRYAVILDGLVVNVAEWDGESAWAPGEQYDVIGCPPEVAAGWTHSDRGFSEPDVGETPP